MSKITIRDNFRVEVYPAIGRRRFSSGNNDAEKSCKEIVREIKRHVDDVFDVEVICDTRVECSFCGLEWEVCEKGCEDCPQGTPQCCNAAGGEWERNQETKNEERATK